MQKADTKDQPETPPSASLPDKKLQDARQLINIFILAWKNYGLYPEDHVTTVKSFENLVGAFGNFFSNHGDLRLNVEKDRFFCESEIIHEVSPEVSSENIITLLYRDGIKWIEFQEGLTLDEIASFFRIAFKYRLFAEETEGDIVTALMDEELEYIDFKAVDIFWQDLLLMDFSRLPSPAPQQEEGSEQNDTDPPRQQDKPDSGEKETPGGNTDATSIADPSINLAELELSNGDYEILQQMVREEESWDITDDLFEVLLIILKSQPEQEKFAEVLGYLSEVAAESIKLDKFDLLVKHLQALHELFSRKTAAEENWRSSLIDRFFHDLSRPELFQLISEKLLKLRPGEINKLKALAQALRFFSPEGIPYLVPVIIQRNSDDIQQVVTEAIVRMSRRDIGPLEKIAEKHGAEIGDKLLVILKHLQGERANKTLLKMCDYSSDRVRKKAIRELIDRDPIYAQKLFPLIDDPSREIRTCVLTALSKHKSSALESMLLNYLKGNSAQKDPDHILACYKTLGHCGSNMSVPYLRRILLSRGWNSFIGSGKLVFREGAATALALIDTTDARDVLRNASMNRFSVIRKAFDSIKVASEISRENTND